jgi:hypothetical protein
MNRNVLHCWLAKPFCTLLISFLDIFGNLYFCLEHFDIMSIYLSLKRKKAPV